MHSNGPVLDDEVLADPEVQAAIKEEGSVHRKFSIVNTDRAAFGRVGGAVARLHGDSGFAGTLSFDLEVHTPNSISSLAKITLNTSSSTYLFVCSSSESFWTNASG